MILKKTCPSCGVEKDLDAFHYDKQAKYNRSCYCIECQRMKSKISRTKNADKVKERGRRFYTKHKDKLSQERKDLYKTKVSLRLASHARQSVRQTFNRQYIKIPKDYMSFLGCNLSDYQKHIESKWKEGMSWDNFGKGAGHWQIDHILPLCSFDVSETAEAQKAFHYSNTEPVWHQIHGVKSGEDRNTCFKMRITKLIKNRIYIRLLEDALNNPSLLFSMKVIAHEQLQEIIQ